MTNIRQCGGKEDGMSDFMANTKCREMDTANSERDEAIASAWDFIRPKLADLNREGGPADVWSKGFRSGWDAARRSATRT